MTMKRERTKILMYPGLPPIPFTKILNVKEQDDGTIRIRLKQGNTPTEIDLDVARLDAKSIQYLRDEQRNKT